MTQCGFGHRTALPGCRLTMVPGDPLLRVGVPIRSPTKDSACRSGRGIVSRPRWAPLGTRPVRLHLLGEHHSRCSIAHLCTVGYRPRERQQRFARLTNETCRCPWGSTDVAGRCCLRSWRVATGTAGGRRAPSLLVREGPACIESCAEALPGNGRTAPRSAPSPWVRLDGDVGRLRQYWRTGDWSSPGLRPAARTAIASAPVERRP